MTPTRIMIVDDHTLFLKSVVRTLKRSADIDVVAVAKDGPTALRLAREHLPDVVVMDVGLPQKEDGIEATRWIVSNIPSVKVLAMSGYCNDKACIEAMLDAGAIGYVGKTCDLPEMKMAIHETAKGRTFFCADTAATLIGKDPRSGLSELTTRETEVLTLLAEGRNTKEIAFDLHLSVNTIYTYQARIKKNLGLSTMADLIRYGVVQKLRST